MTNAQLYCDALAARRWHQANNARGDVPAALEIDAIKKKHLATVLELHEEYPQRIVFLDCSVAVKHHGRAWQVAM